MLLRRDLVSNAVMLLRRDLVIDRSKISSGIILNERDLVVNGNSNAPSTGSSRASFNGI